MNSYIARLSTPLKGTAMPWSLKISFALGYVIAETIADVKSVERVSEE